MKSVSLSKDDPEIKDDYMYDQDRPSFSAISCSKDTLATRGKGKCLGTANYAPPNHKFYKVF